VVKEKENAEFFRQMVRLRAAFNPYFSAGEMARPPKLLGPTPTVRADWQWSGEWWVTTDAVLTGAWQLPKEKRMVLLLVNVSDESVHTRLHFDAPVSGIRTSELRIQRTTTNGVNTEWQSSPASFERGTTLPPREAEAWELRW